MPHTDAASLLDDLSVAYERDVPLGPLTWYGVGGPAQFFVQPESVEQLSELVGGGRSHHVPVYVLGSGANLLVADEGVPGVVVKLDAPAFRELHQEPCELRVGAGYDLFRLVTETARRGLAGMEVVAGIPASVGGAVRMNAGGAFGEIGSIVRRVRVMAYDGTVRWRDRAELSFGYRRTNIDEPLILEVGFELGDDDPIALMKRVKEIFLYKKNSQPLAASSAGCAFKNPPREYGSSAGELIDQAGLKGYQTGGARISAVHANFVEAEEGATATDVRHVIEHAQATVEHQFGVRLEREVVFWP